MRQVQTGVNVIKGVHPTLTYQTGFQIVPVVIFWVVLDTCVISADEAITS